MRWKKDLTTFDSVCTFECWAWAEVRKAPGWDFRTSQSMGWQIVPALTILNHLNMTHMTQSFFCAGTMTQFDSMTFKRMKCMIHMMLSERDHNCPTKTMQRVDLRTDSYRTSLECMSEVENPPCCLPWSIRAGGDLGRMELETQWNDEAIKCWPWNVEGEWGQRTY